MLPQLVGTAFQVLFHSPPGVLFTFPSQYYSLSVTEEYLALRARLGLALCGPKPHGARTMVWALPRSLAATYGIIVIFSSSGYLDVSVHRVPSV